MDFLATLSPVFLSTCRNPFQMGLARVAFYLIDWLSYSKFAVMTWIPRKSSNSDMHDKNQTKWNAFSWFKMASRVSRPYGNPEFNVHSRAARWCIFQPDFTNLVSFENGFTTFFQSGVFSWFFFELVYSGLLRRGNLVYFHQRDLAALVHSSNLFYWHLLQRLWLPGASPFTWTDLLSSLWPLELEVLLGNHK